MHGKPFPPPAPKARFPSVAASAVPNFEVTDDDLATRIPSDVSLAEFRAGLNRHSGFDLKRYIAAYGNKSFDVSGHILDITNNGFTFAVDLQVPDDPSMNVTLYCPMSMEGKLGHIQRQGYYLGATAVLYDGPPSPLPPSFGSIFLFKPVVTYLGPPPAGTPPLQ
jgi:hypothetical protein